MDTFREQQLNAIKRRVLNIFEQKRKKPKSAIKKYQLFILCTMNCKINIMT